MGSPCLEVKDVIIQLKKKEEEGTSLMVQWLRLCAPNLGGTGSIPGQEIKIPHAAWHGQKIKFKN